MSSGHTVAAPALHAAADRRRHFAPAEPGLRWVAGYKLARAVFAWLVAAVLLILAATGRTHQLHEAALVLLHQVTHAWTVMLAKLLVDAASARHLYLAAVALLLDGALSFVEGWTLYRGLRWGPLLVLGTTGGLIPFELVYLARRFRVGRLVVLLVNLAIVAYVARRTLRERAHARTAHA